MKEVHTGDLDEIDPNSHDSLDQIDPKDNDDEFQNWLKTIKRND